MFSLSRSIRRIGAIGCGILWMVEGGCRGRPLSFSAHPYSSVAVEEAGRSTKGIIAQVDLTAGIPEQGGGSPWALSPSRISFDAFVKRMEEVFARSDVRGVYVNFGDAQFGFARALEVGTLLGQIRKNHVPVVCYAEELTNATMMAAAEGCTQIYVSPAGTVGTVGIGAQVVYMRRLLSDQLHLSVDILQVGKFKGAEEPLTRDGPSEEAQATLRSTLTDIRVQWLDRIQRGRSSEKTVAAAEDGPYAPDKAMELGLIDAVGYKQQAQEAIQKLAGVTRMEPCFGTDRNDNRFDWGILVQMLTNNKGLSLSAPVALVRAVGNISMGETNGLSTGGISEKELSRVLARLEQDDAVKAVVLRVDSPGGSALASDLLWNQMMRLRRKKVLVASIGDMAASGGYYLASAAQWIYASPTSIVGSIGVVGGKIGIGKALEHLGIHTETFVPYGVSLQAINRSVYMSPLVEWDDATRMRILEGFVATYTLFVHRVATGRELPPAKIQEVAEGRIFGGREGKEKGLVDELGGLREAIARARMEAKLPADAVVETVEVGSPLLQMMTLVGGGADEFAHAVNVKTTALELFSKWLPLVSLEPFAQRDELVMTVLPYFLQVR
ncbi:S49 family peptidase [Pajaroellobacter abortibovis]|uniref:Peptidase S49 domain-containing protein n=1 Tax=Pajaroellobacter abortibovis TaxID=1882918 RepID=A0A1L6MWJ5_9BACT|nr:S49 family peptidase [Pajaroellobacter abortibovis]APR99788.1 hypothetical protein BCY86_03185 [Pajaroellobacter abortibovis]